MSAEHRPIIGDRSGVPEKPFIPLCSCGWAGHVQATRPLAEREHDDHLRQQVWLVWIGNGRHSHAAFQRGDRTFCGRSTATAREWVPPGGGDPGCESCYRKAIRHDLLKPDFSGVVQP